MSMYTTLEIELTTSTLTQTDVTTLLSKITPSCGVSDFRTFGTDTIKFKLTYNYALDKVVSLLASLEGYINYVNPTYVGELTSEQLSLYSFDVYAYKNKLFCIHREDQAMLIGDQVIYTFDNLRKITQTYAIYNGEKPLEDLLNDFKFILTAI